MRCGVCTETVNPNGHFCQWCGTPIGENVVRLATRSDRRYATVLFADIVDSTSMVRGVEPEAALERLSPILEVMKRTITEHGGTICRDQGDGVMALFGAPLSDDRHALNASLAGAAMLARTAATVPFHAACRIGIHSGVVAGHLVATSSGPYYTASGEVVHLAARLESAAHAGTVLVSEATYRLIEGRFAARERRLTAIKGYEGEVTAFELENPASLSRLLAQSRQATLPFCGRADEIARLREMYADPMADFVVISGDPAVGKSKLANEFIDGCDPPPAGIHIALCEQSLLRTPYAALRRLALSIMGLPLDASGHQVELGLLAFVRRTDAATVRDESAIRFLLGLPMPDRQWAELESATKRRRIVSAVADLLSRQIDLGARSIVLFEDAHLADSASIAALHALRTRVADGSCFFMATTRDVAVLQGALPSPPTMAHLPLEPLAKDACESILDDLLGRSQTLLRLKGRMLELGGGIPLFLQQIVQWLVETQALVGNPGSYRLAVHADQLELPASLRAVTLWRVDRLPVRSRQVLGLAAVLQQDVSASAIAAMSDLDAAQAQSELESLLERGLLMRQDGIEESLFTFRHTLLRESVYESLTHERRNELHAKALQLLEATASDGHAYRHGLMSMHAFASHNWAAVAKYSQVVGERAIAASAYREAAGHFEHAVDALYRLPRERQTLEAAIDARLQARVCYSAMAKHDLCIAHIQRAAELAEEIGDNQRVLACTIYRAGVLNFTGPVRESLAIAVAAFAKAQAMETIPHIAIAGYVLGQAYYAAGDFGNAVGAFAAGGRRLVGEKALLRLGTTGTAAAMCASLQAASHASLGEFPDASACLARARGIARQTGRPYDIISHAYAEGITRSLQGDRDGAIVAFERALDACRAGDIETFVTTLSGQLGQAYILDGRVAAALALLEPALEEALSLQNLPQIATLKRQLGFAALQQNDLDRAKRLAGEAATIAGSAGYRMIHASALHLQAMVCLRAGGGQLDAGLEAAGRSTEILRAIGAVPSLPAVQETLAQLHARKPSAEQGNIASNEGGLVSGRRVLLAEESAPEREGEKGRFDATDNSG